MTQHTHSVDLEDEVERLEEKCSEIRSEAREAGRGSEQAEALDNQYKSLMGRLRAYERALDDWEGSEFVVHEMTGGEIFHVKDEVDEVSYRMDQNTGSVEGVPKSGFYKLKVLEIAVDRTPAGAPDDPKDLHHHIVTWLYDRVDAFNTVGEASMDDFSVWEDIEE